MAYEGDDNKDVPVILWLNGGPGCSSLDGLVYEHGPFRINATDPTKLYRFDETWAKVGHMLYLESPLGVGYSYSNDKADYNVDDDQTAAQNLAAVEKFFALYPELGARDFFITGESYAGVYVPTLSKEIRPVCKKFCQDPMEVYVDDEAKLTLHGLQQYYIKLAENEKNRKLNDLLDALEFNQVIIFVSKVARAIELNKLLVECNFPSICSHGGLKQPERLRRLKEFKDFKKRYGDKIKDVYKEVEEVSKPYSFASSPSDRSHFDIITKNYGPRRGQDVPPGLLSSYLHKHIRVGDVVTVSEPTGTLYEDNDSGRPIVVLAGGVGASPFVGLLKYWFENNVNEKRKIYFFLGVRSRRDLLLHEQFLKWTKEKKNFYYVPGLSRPQPDDDWQ